MIGFKHFMIRVVVILTLISSSLSAVDESSLNPYNAIETTDATESTEKSRRIGMKSSSCRKKFFSAGIQPVYFIGNNSWLMHDLG